jgi:hypothetical protein
MKIENIKIIIAEEVKKTSTQAYVMRYNMSQEQYPIYTMDPNDPPAWLRSRGGPSISVELCPKCAAEYKVQLRSWNVEQNVEMVCMYVRLTTTCSTR